MADTTPPILTALAFPATVNLAAGARGITFTMSGTDNASGIWGAIIWFSGVLVDGHNFIALYGTTDSWADGTSTQTGTVRADVPPGVYTIDKIELTDGLPNFNDAGYTTAQLAALGFPTQITVVDTDTVAPQLLSLTFPTAIDVTAAAQPATFAATAADDATGIDEIVINFDKSLLTGPGAPGQIVISDRVADPWSDGASAFIATVPEDLPSGLYSITDAKVKDKAGNVRTYTPAELQALGIATSIAVTGGGPADTTKPQLESLTIPTAVVIGPGSAPITIAAEATDPSGIDDLTIWLDRNVTLSTGAAGGFLLNGAGDSWSDGESSGTWTISAAASAGLYRIDHVDVQDTFGNTAAYTAAQLGALGFRTAFFVLDASFNVAANAVIGGTLGDDTVQGTEVNNVLFGLDGNDTLICGGGGDWMYGGLGDDIYRVKSDGDRIIEAAGEGIDRVFVSVSFTLTINQEIEFFATADASSTVAINLIGNGFGNAITGNAGSNILDGGDGNDSLLGGDGADQLYGNTGDDTIGGDDGDDIAVGAGGKDTIAGGLGRDFLFGAGFSSDGSFAAGSGDDMLHGGDGDDGLWGGDGLDILNGDAGNDGIACGAGNDTMNGGEGNDFLFGGDFSIVNGSRLPNSGDDTLNGGAGNDALYGFDGADTINCDAGDDYVEAGEGGDIVNGGADSDTLLGQDGADTINGGTGFDYLYGGTGADVFSFRKGDSYDTAWDCSAAQGDKLRLDPALGVTTFAQFQARLTGFTFEGVAYSRINFASLGSNDEITIGGIAHTAWTAGMVEFA